MVTVREAVSTLKSDRAIVFAASEIGEGQAGEASRKAVGAVEEQVAESNERSARQTYCLYRCFRRASVGTWRILLDEIVPELLLGLML
jgi:hypothetical protein